MMNLTKTEPAVLIGAIEAVVIAVVGLLAYVFEWDAEFAALLIAAIGSIVALIGAIIIRQNVYSPETVDELTKEGE